jgi:hypothetical protein
MARRNGGVCRECGGNFFTDLLGHVARGINAIASYRKPNNYPGLTNFPAAVQSRNMYRNVGINYRPVNVPYG